MEHGRAVRQVSVCLKCSVRSEPVQAHLYSAKAVLKGCMAYHTCQRCGQRDGGAWAHAFGEPTQEGCITSHTCQRCGHREELLVQHEREHGAAEVHGELVVHSQVRVPVVGLRRAGQARDDQGRRRKSSDRAL